LLEWDGFAVDGDKDGHLNLGFETALDALRFSPLTPNEEKEIITKFDIGGQKSGAIFNSIANPFFRADYLTAGHSRVESGFGIFLSLAGDGKMKFENDQTLDVKQGDAVVIPHCAGGFTLSDCSGILSRPPAA
jgi:mannose-6-phosphate isomerase